MPLDLEARLRALEDRAEISQLRATFCHYVDQHRWEDLLELFTNDGWYEGFERAEGREELRDYFESAPQRRDAAWHRIANETVTLDGDAATGRCYFDVPMVKNGQPYVCAGYYDDHLRRVAGRWRFAGRTAHFFYVAPLSEGWRNGVAPAAAR